MKYSLIFLISIILLSSKLSANQLSAFGAGNLNSSSPYGLSSDEKVIDLNKKGINNLKLKSFLLVSKITSLRERLDGLQTVLEGMGQTSNKNRLALQILSKNIQNISTTLMKKINDINQSLSKITILLNMINNNYISKSAFNSMIIKINQQYVTQNEFNKLVTGINQFKSIMLKELKKKYTRQNNHSLTKISDDVLYKKAYLYYIHKKYTLASQYYKYLITKAYMAATSNFMLGEINYKKFKFSKAIAYYKRSVLLYGKSRFMPILLFHSAISMQKTKDILNAKKFFNALILKYPTSIQAKRAKKILKLLK